MIATIEFYIANVIAIALPLALFEIWLEKFKNGWGGEFRHPFWGKKITHNAFRRMEKAYLTPYHLLMFLGVIPGIFALEYIVMLHVGIYGGFILWIHKITIVPWLFFPAIWIGVAALEDFLWFALNWKYPDALEKFFRGELAWHTHWVSITPSKKVPRFYLISPILIAILLALQYLIAVHR